MLFDLCEVNHRNGLFKYRIETNKGTQDKEAVLNEQDSLFCELRHEHIAAVLVKLAEKAKEFSAKGSSARLNGESTTGQIKKVVQSLPRFMEAQAKLSTHTSIAAQINHLLNQRNLSNVGGARRRSSSARAIPRRSWRFCKTFARTRARWTRRTSFGYCYCTRRRIRRSSTTPSGRGG